MWGRESLANRLPLLGRYCGTDTSYSLATIIMLSRLRFIKLTAKTV